MSRQQLENILAPLLRQPRQRFSIEGVRRDWYVESDEIPASLDRKAFRIGNVPAEWLGRPGSRRDRAVLYLHGGGYVCGSIKTHRTLTNELATQFDGGVVSIDYRLAPEVSFPAPVDDTVAAYRYLLDSGCPASGIAIAGDSAGGGLAVAAALQCRMQGLPPAGAVWAISPWANLTNLSAALDDSQKQDPIVFKESLVACAEAYLGKHAPTDPLASPVLGDFSGLPALLIQVGAREILVDDAIQLARGAAAANVDVTLRVWPDMVHVWHLLAPQLDEGREAIAEAVRWLGQRLR